MTTHKKHRGTYKKRKASKTRKGKKRSYRKSKRNTSHRKGRRRKSKHRFRGSGKPDPPDPPPFGEDERFDKFIEEERKKLGKKSRVSRALKPDLKKYEDKLKKEKLEKEKKEKLDALFMPPSSSQV